MADLNELLDLIPLDQLGAKLGVDAQTARATAATALPSLLAGLQNNAASPEGEDALATAIAQHDAKFLDGGVDIDAVDTEDGQKIVQHSLGENQSALTAQLSGAAPGGVDLGALVQKALPILAPIVMSFLAKKLSSSQGGLGGLLGGMLGGQGPAAGQQPGGLDLGGILGGLFGGGSTQQQQPQQGQAPGGLDLGGILGGLFGKK
ncbi:DUF937 domain-containing protein [Paeniglutamicibacter sp. ABSL32-1]|uniref:DUF937 domain-containing protein n=1 Tax=Paeniglutamicibacter quisquiliarum TaxID=2849498 RepID=UPI001C2D24B4|nr:DUF937 domain-containing protein [Paeniglutamicibacter quisquiliarum]MBV1780099.1 DUF937 domain-containing protein [Paeniglutamicibacter quisquiliarum]